MSVEVKSLRLTLFYNPGKCKSSIVRFRIMRCVSFLFKNCSIKHERRCQSQNVEETAYRPMPCWFSSPSLSSSSCQFWWSFGAGCRNVGQLRKPSWTKAHTPQSWRLLCNNNWTKVTHGINRLNEQTQTLNISALASSILAGGIKSDNKVADCVGNEEEQTEADKK